MASQEQRSYRASKPTSNAICANMPQSRRRAASATQEEEWEQGGPLEQVLVQRESAIQDMVAL